MYFVNYLHRQGIGVIIDWVPRTFPKISTGWPASTVRRYMNMKIQGEGSIRIGEHSSSIMGEMKFVIFSFQCSVLARPVSH